MARTRTTARPQLTTKSSTTQASGSTLVTRRATRTKKRNYSSYSTYIRKIMFGVYPDLAVTSAAMVVLNAFANDIFDRLAKESGSLARGSKKNTITSREIQTSVRLLLPGELAKHAIAEGLKAVAKFQTASDIEKVRKSGDTAKTGAAKRSGPKGSSRSMKAGLIFPIGRVHSFLREGRYADRVGAGAPIYLAAVLEYLLAEVIELAGISALERKRQRISPREIQLAVRNDSELCILMNNVTIVDGGVLPTYQLMKKKEKAEAREAAAAKAAVTFQKITHPKKPATTTKATKPVPNKKAAPQPSPLTSNKKPLSKKHWCGTT